MTPPGWIESLKILEAGSTVSNHTGIAVWVLVL